MCILIFFMLEMYNYIILFWKLVDFWEGFGWFRILLYLVLFRKFKIIKKGKIVEKKCVFFIDVENNLFLLFSNFFF